MNCQILKNNYIKIILLLCIITIYWNVFAVEIYKVANGMSPEIINEVFKQRNNPHYNLRHTSQLPVNQIHSVSNVYNS